MILNHHNPSRQLRQIAFAIGISIFSLLLHVGCGEREASHAEKGGAHAGEAEGEEAGHVEGPPPAYVDTTLGEDPAFEWVGVFPLPAGTLDLAFQPGPDGTMNLAIIPVTGEGEAALAAAIATAKRVAEGKPTPTEPGTAIAPGERFYALNVEGKGEMRFPVNVATAGRYALFTQHFADEFQTTFLNGNERVRFGPQKIFKDRFGQIPITAEAVAQFGVTVQPIGMKELTPTIPAPARVSYDMERMAYVGSAVAGRVSDLKVRQGDLVKRGDVLLIVDSPELGEAQSEFLQRRTMVKTAKPAVALAQSAFDRAQQLFDKNQSIALAEVQKRQGELQAAQGTLATAEASLIAASSKLSLLGMNEEAVKTLEDSGKITPIYTIRAAIDGQVIRRDVTLGELVAPDRDALLVLADTTQVWVVAEVPEAKLKDLAAGATATVTIAALPGESFEGTVAFVAPELDEATRTVRVRIVVKNEAGRLRPGMFAQVQIAASAAPTTQSALVVPESAVQSMDGQSVVFVPMADKPDTFLKRAVTLDPAVGNLWPVRYGLFEGEPIVTASSFILKAELGKSSAEHGH